MAQEAPSFHGIVSKFWLMRIYYVKLTAISQYLTGIEFFLHHGFFGDTGKRKVLATKYITAMMTLIQCPEQPTPLEIYMTWTTNLTQ